ncbi:MAG: hypothetical protein HYV18_07755 [Gammaproteobacteria bacterium]|nr:hypothetical protein [Gammaproteobacteria bacterium]
MGNANSRAPVAAPGLDFGNWSRRRVIKALLAGGGLAATGGLAGCGRGGGMGPDGYRLLVLDVAQASTLSALGDALIPRQEGFPDLVDTELLRRVDEELSFIGESIQSDLGAALAVLEWAPFLYWRFGRFSSLEREERREVLDRMLRSRSETLRAVSTNLRILVQFFYFGHPAAWAAIGYDGPFSHLPPIESEQRRFYAENTGRRRNA